MADRLKEAKDNAFIQILQSADLMADESESRRFIKDRLSALSDADTEEAVRAVVECADAGGGFL